MSRGEAACDVCGHPGAMGQCWRLTCPTNGGSMKLSDLADASRRAAPEDQSIRYIGEGTRHEITDLFITEETKP